VQRTSVNLADGRELIYFGAVPKRPADYPDRRALSRAEVLSQQRFDPLLGEWVIVASHRQSRPVNSTEDHCPLCPSTTTSLTEIPAPAYDVVVLENRFPALGAQDVHTVTAAPEPHPAFDGAVRPAPGRCEVVCFSQDHDASFADLTPDHAAIVLEAWIDRTTELSQLPGVEQVYCFENRGREIGVTLSHPHGQIYAYPFVTARTARMLSMCAAHGRQTGSNLFDEVLAAELSAGSRIVVAGKHWVAFVPRASRWACEVHLYPSRRVPDLAALTEAAKTEFCTLYLDILGRFDRLWGSPAPYVSAVHQAPVREGREQFALHVELFSIRRGVDALQYLAGSELGMGVFAVDADAETTAERLRQLG
jgi:UDPglucose--hexose-1-phosphate uridylyltransferase